MQTDGLSLIYTTLPERAVAEKIARMLVERRLVACANILAAMTSIYEWQGTLEEAMEVPMLLKTTHERVSEAMAALRELHPFDTPAIISWRADASDAAYLTWAKTQVVRQ